MLKINEIDAKILKNLLRDGRISYEELAKDCKTSKNRVWKRCRAMEKKGIIKGATIQLNFVQFGFDATATLLLKVDPQQMETTMEMLDKIPEIHAYRQYNSVYNVRAIATLRDLNGLDHVKHIIREKLPTTNFKTYIWTGIRNIPENVNLTCSSKSSPQKSLQKPANRLTEETIDEIDKKIAQKLTHDGRVSFTEIAKQIGLSAHTVIKRYQHLKKIGAIKVTLQINPNKLGYDAILDFNIAFTTLRGLSINIVDALARIPDVIMITRTSGDFDLQVTAIVRDLKQAFLIQEEIARISGVTQIEASARKIPDKWPTQQQYITTI